MKISVFTPTNNASFLGYVYDSLKAQTYTDWEWIVLCNGSATYHNDDERVRCFHESSGIDSIGYLKRIACTHCTGDVLLELDHDDLLTPDALMECAKAFSCKDVDFAYSNSVNHDTRVNKPVVWDSRYGWQYRPFKSGAFESMEAVSAPPSPQSISRIWFAPNHFRAWRKSFYWNIGGHDATMNVADDHDLICRTYVNGTMRHIDKPLYIYRIHGNNTWLARTGEITEKMLACHDKYIEPMMHKWALDKSLRCIDVCGGVDPEYGYESVDIENGSITADLNEKWPFKDSEVGIIRAHDAIEHLQKPIHTMNEAYRVLAHGGLLDILVPSTDGVGAFCDPGHVSFWNKRSFRYYTEAGFKKYVRGYTGRFQILQLKDVRMWDEQIPYVLAHLIAIKDGERFYGELLC